MTLLSFYTSSLHLDTAFHVTNKCIATTEVKSVGTFPMILVKLATSPLPTQTILNFEQSPLGVTALSWGEGGGEKRGFPKIVIRSKVLCNNYLQGFLHRVPSSFGLHCSEYQD